MWRVYLKQFQYLEILRPVCGGGYVCYFDLFHPISSNFMLYSHHHYIFFVIVLAFRMMLSIICLEVASKDWNCCSDGLTFVVMFPFCRCNTLLSVFSSRSSVRVFTFFRYSWSNYLQESHSHGTYILYPFCCMFQMMLVIVLNSVPCDSYILPVKCCTINQIVKMISFPNIVWIC